VGAVKATVDWREIPIAVPVAAEIRTDRGNALGVFEPDVAQPDVEMLLSWETIIDEVHRMGGLVGLPHRFRAHRVSRGVGPRPRLHPMFDTRCTMVQKAKALVLAETSGLVLLRRRCSPLHELDRAIVEYER
jgi:hypothetical protein